MRILEGRPMEIAVFEILPYARGFGGSTTQWSNCAKHMENLGNERVVFRAGMLERVCWWLPPLKTTMPQMVQRAACISWHAVHEKSII